jgi:hypothetical protein
MYQIVSLEKQLRIECQFSSDLRLRETLCDVEIVNRVFLSMTATERHVNRGGRLGLRVVMLRCDKDSFDIDNNLQPAFQCTLRTVTDPLVVVDVGVERWTKELRVTVESSDMRIAKPCQVCISAAGNTLGTATAYEPQTTGSTREIIITDSDLQMESQLLSSLASGITCHLTIVGSADA